MQDNSSTFQDKLEPQKDISQEEPVEGQASKKTQESLIKDNYFYQCYNCGQALEKIDKLVCLKCNGLIFIKRQKFKYTSYEI